MSMRTWVRKMAHAKAEKAGVEHVNKRQIRDGKIYPSKFALNWRDFATVQLPRRANHG